MPTVEPSSPKYVHNSGSRIPHQRHHKTAREQCVQFSRASSAEAHRESEDHLHVESLQNRRMFMYPLSRTTAREDPDFQEGRACERRATFGSFFFLFSLLEATQAMTVSCWSGVNWLHGSPANSSLGLLLLLLVLLLQRRAEVRTGERVDSHVRRVCQQREEGHRRSPAGQDCVHQLRLGLLQDAWPPTCSGVLL